MKSYYKKLSLFLVIFLSLDLVTINFVYSKDIHQSKKIKVEVKFKDLILGKSTFYDALKKIKVNSYDNINSYSNIETINGYHADLKSENAHEMYLLNNEDSHTDRFKNYDIKNRIKGIKGTITLFKEKYEFLMLFLDNKLAEITILINYRFPNDKLTSIYGSYEVNGWYEYPNIKVNWTLDCLSWGYGKGNCDSATILISEYQNGHVVGHKEQYKENNYTEFYSGLKLIYRDVSLSEDIRIYLYKLHDNHNSDVRKEKEKGPKSEL